MPTVLRNSDGSAWSWGGNANGFLGDNTLQPRSSPVSVVGNHSFNTIVVGSSHVLAIKATDGSVWSWGGNANGFLGDNTLQPRSSPVSVIGNHSFDAIGAGDISVGLKFNDGSVWTWGINAQGELGDNSATPQRSSPISVVGNHSFIQVGSTSAHSFSLKADGSAWTWGNNTNGALGDNSVAHRSSPVSVIGNHSFVSIVGGGNGASNPFTLALKADGSAWAWGSGSLAELGDGTTQPRSSPVSVIGNHSFIMLGTGSVTSAGLKTDGSVWGWGINLSGEVGDGTLAARSSPVSVIGNHSFVKIATGGQNSDGNSSNANTHALKADGSVWSWGNRANGALGNNTDITVGSPVQAVGNHSFSSLRTIAGGVSTGLKSTDGSVWNWGPGTNAQLGEGNVLVNRSSPVSVIGNHSFVAIATGNFNSGALKSDGSAWGWALGTSGQLGDGTTKNRSSPVSVIGNHSFTFLGSVGGVGSFALKSDGSAWGWGTDGGSGQLGQGSTTAGRSSPVSVIGNHSFIFITGYISATYALKADGSVWAWGLGNGSGELGIGLLTNRSSPVSVIGNHSFVALTASNNSGHGLKSIDGSVWGWGAGTSGQLGEGTVAVNRSSPVSVIGNHSFVAVGGGSAQTLALKADGSAWSWGGNAFSGDLGDNTTINRSSPVSVVGNHSFIAIYGGTSYSTALKADGSVWSWGVRSSGTLGDNNDVQIASPVQILPLTPIKKVAGLVYAKFGFDNIGTGDAGIKRTKKISGTSSAATKKISGQDRKVVLLYVQVEL